MKKKAKHTDTLPSKRPVRIKSAFDVNRLLARTINQLLRGEVEHATAGKVGYLCNVLLHSFELTQIEQRLETLEKQANQLGNPSDSPDSVMPLPSGSNMAGHSGKTVSGEGVED